MNHKAKRISVALDLVTYEKFHKLAELKHLSVDRAARLIIAAYVAEKEKEHGR